MGDLQLPGFMRRDFRVDFILDSDHPVPIVRNKQVDEFSGGGFLFGLYTVRNTLLNLRYECRIYSCNGIKKCDECMSIPSPAIWNDTFPNALFRLLPAVRGRTDPGVVV